jgi:hypothetical protein
MRFSRMHCIFAASWNGNAANNDQLPTINVEQKEFGAACSLCINC